MNAYLLLACLFCSTDPEPARLFIGPELPTEAERIVRLQRAIDADTSQLAMYKAALEDPEGEYIKAETRFRSVDGQLEESLAEIRRLKAEGKPSDLAKKEADHVALTSRWRNARERFTLAIDARKTLREKVIALQAKVERDRQTLERVIKPTSDRAASPKSEPSTPQSPATTTAMPAAAASAAAPPTATIPTPREEKQSKELIKARERLHVKGQEAAEAAERVRSIAERVEVILKQIELEKKTLQTARQQADLARKVETETSTELNERRTANAPVEDLERLEKRRGAAEQRFARLRTESRSSNDRLSALQQEIASLREEQLLAEREAHELQKESDQAQRDVARLQNPFTPHNLAQWGLTHGPKLVLVVVGAFLLYRLVNLFSQRIVLVVARAGQRGTEEDAENRAQTLVGVFRNAASGVILIGGTLLFLESAGIPIVPLMGGAAIMGLAVAFGAQNLIRDYFSGFMVLLEDQYGVKDVVKIGDVTGQVENITLRMTVLRDIEGVLHFIPHGTITHVSNMTHGWSRALFEIGVSYKEDMDRVMAVLLELAQDLRRDSTFGPLILDDPQMLGVDQFGESAITIKFFIKTKPLHQWPVKRELLRRIKLKFDEVGIEIPFPHRTVYHRYEGAMAAPRLIGAEEAA